MTAKLSEQARQRVAELKLSYPDPRSAVMPALYIAQEELGYLSEEALLWVAGEIGLAPVHVRELATFYSMYYTRRPGRYHVQVCGTLSCALAGSVKLIEHLARRFAVAPMTPTADGLWSYGQVECLGSCGSGPVVQINDTCFEKMNVDRLEKLIRRIEAEKPDLSLSTVRDELGKGLAGKAGD